MDVTDPAVRAAVARFVAESTGDSVLVSDTDGVMRWVSPSMTRILGWSFDDLVGHRTREFVHEEDLAALAGLRAASGDTSALLRIRRSDGSHMWSRVLSRRLVDEAGTQVARISVFRDVDAEVTSQRALAESEHWYRLLAENLTDFVTMASPEGALTWASPSASTVLGWTPDEVYGRPTASFLHPDDIPRLVELRGQMAEGRASTLRARVQRADGSYRWFELSIRPVYEDGVLVGRATAYRDVQAEVEAQAALAASERQFRLLAENAADVVVQIEGDTVAWASPSLAAGLGWDPQEWVGASFTSYAHADDIEDVRAHQQEALVGPTRRRYRLRARDGGHHWVDSHAGPYGDGSGGSILVASFRVIDDLVRTEQELDRRARFDTVTGLINRHEALERLAVGGRRSGELTAVLFADVDRFKEINDTRGHAAGDEVLRILAERITGAIRRDDVAARIGGDEFLVILSGVHDTDEAARVAEGIRRAAAGPIAVDGEPVVTSLSIGVTVARVDEAPDDLLARADLALYDAKRAGRDRVATR